MGKTSSSDDFPSQGGCGLMLKSSLKDRKMKKIVRREAFLQLVTSASAHETQCVYEHEKLNGTKRQTGVLKRINYEVCHLVFF